MAIQFCGKPTSRSRLVTTKILSLLIFVLAGLCEIGGSYLVWLWVREGKSIWLALGRLIFLAAYGFVATLQPATYVSELDSPVRGLTAQAVDDLLNGRGAGYAMTAELNSYPEPRHVLDLRQELELSPEQIQRIEAIFQHMSEAAKPLGQAIVEREQEFSSAFASGTLTEAEIDAQTQEIARLYGEYRAIHLQPHFKIKHLLAPEQIAKCDQLRGYSNLETQSTPNLHHQNR